MSEARLKFNTCYSPEHPQGALLASARWRKCREVAARNRCARRSRPPSSTPDPHEKVSVKTAEERSTRATHPVISDANKLIRVGDRHSSLVLELAGQME